MSHGGDRHPAAVTLILRMSTFVGGRNIGCIDKDEEDKKAILSAGA